MRYMLDTDICSYLMRRSSDTLLEKLQMQAQIGSKIGISVITYMELRLGAERSAASDKYNHLIDELEARLDFIADWTKLQARMFALCQADLLNKGTPIGNNDVMIAVHALTTASVLITNNERHFSRVPDLMIENWIR